MKFNENFDFFGVGVTHHFGDDGSDVYIKSVQIPKGLSLSMHQHTFTHKSVLVSGKVILKTPNEQWTVTAPAIFTLGQGIPHEVVSLEDSLWLCIHATDENDPEKIDHTLVMQ